MPKNILQVSNLRIERDRTVILDDISWRVERGQHWALLGANGSGKTSLLSSLAGYLNFTSGEIEVFGEKFGETDWRELRKKIGLVSSSIRQMLADAEPALLTVLSGKEAMIDVWGNGSPKDRSRARKILKQVECEYLADRPWQVLSQGERQRVLVGRALMANPRLLILDEPCAGLDPVARENLLQFLQRLGAQETSPALVLVTHHIEEIMPVFSHALVLKSGRIIGIGEKLEMSLPADPRTPPFATYTWDTGTHFVTITAVCSDRGRFGTVIGSVDDLARTLRLVDDLEVGESPGVLRLDPK